MQWCSFATLGQTLSSFTKRTLPTKQDVLRRILHLHYKSNLVIKECIVKVVIELIDIWRRSLVPLRDKARVKTAVQSYRIQNDKKKQRSS